MDISEQVFKKLKISEVVSTLKKEKYISVHSGNKRFDLNYESGNRFGIKHTEVITFTVLKKVPKSFHEVEDEGNYSAGDPYVRSPLDFPTAVKEFKRLMKNEIAGKRTRITPLTEMEIEYIVLQMNKPIQTPNQEGYEAYRKGLNLVLNNPYSSEDKCHWEWRKGYLEAFQVENPPMW